MKRIFENKFLQILIMGAIALITLMCIFTPNIMWLRKSADFTVQFMVIFLGLGMVFLALNQKRLMFTALAACGIIALFLRRAGTEELKLPVVETTAPQIQVALFNTSTLDSNFVSSLNIVLDKDPDVISVQELTPEWVNTLDAFFCKKYPNSRKFKRIDPYGMAIYSKFPIFSLDTFYHQNIPNLKAVLDLDKDHKIALFSSYSLPPVNSNAVRSIESHLVGIADEMNKTAIPNLFVGSLNMVPWSNEIQKLRYVSGLNDSRRSSSSTGLLEIPYDHIFYSEDRLEMMNFENINSAQNTHLGIFGKYQLKSSSDVAKQEG